MHTYGWNTMRKIQVKFDIVEKDLAIEWMNILGYCNVEYV